MSKRRFITQRINALEDLNSLFKKGGEVSHVEILEDLLPILKDLIEKSMESKIRIDRLEEKEEGRMEAIENAREVLSEKRTFDDIRIEGEEIK